MFGDSNNKETDRSKVETILGNGTRIEGDIHTSGSLRIEGEVIGEIKAEGDLFVGEAGDIKNHIEARNVVIAGRVESNVIAHEKLEILPSGILSGDIKSKVLKIEEGATFVGSSETLKGKSGSHKKEEKEEKKKKKKKNEQNKKKKNKNK